MNLQRKRTIAYKVQVILQENEITAPPVPVERIAKSLGAQLRFSPLDDELSGMIYVKEGIPIIGVNALHHPNRQRFTIAHECGHLILHKPQISKEVHVDKDFKMLMRDSVSAAGVNEIEIEANLFAAELLMPATLLTDAVGNEAFDIDDEGAVTELAKNFKVSPSAMRFRLGNLFA
jgi:Zn-dependent peptidase ImmA (M78 family)